MELRVLCLADFHGQSPDISGIGFDAILAAGDFCHLFELRKIILSEMAEGKNWWEAVESEKLAKLTEKSVKSGRAVMEYLLSFNRPVLSIPGNSDFFWERPGIPARFGEISKGSVVVQGRAEEISGTRIVGYGGTWAPEEEMDVEGLSELMEMVKEAMPADILMSHVPPYGTKLDVIKYGKLAGKHYGSPFVRSLIEEYGPKFSISGHIHESPGEEGIKGTISINTGPAYEGNAVLIDTSVWSYKRIKIERVFKFY